MDIKVIPSTVCGEIVAPPSKSFAIRGCISTCIYKGQGTVKNIGNSKDVMAVVNCLKQIGYNCTTKDGNFIVDGYEPVENPLLDCDESASCLRFMLAVCSALGIKAKFTGKESLLSRPIDALIDGLNKHGADIKDFCINGRINSGEYTIPADVSSQFISGLMLALCTFKEPSKIILQGNTVSKKYIDMTINVINSFGKRIEKTKFGFDVLPKTEEIIPSEIVVEGDYSGSANFLSLGAVCGEIKVLDLNEKSLQGDRAIINLLHSFGAEVSVSDGEVSVRQNKLTSISIDCQNIIDLVPILAVLGAFSRGATLLKNVDRLKIKESDRLYAIMEMLSVAKINCEYSDGNLTVYGGKPQGGVFESFNDHRIAMACVVLASNCEGESIILDADCIEKSFSSFLVDFKKVGGKYSVVV